MDGRLHRAAIRGDVHSLHDLLQQNEHILDGVGVGVGVTVMYDPISSKNALHVAAQFGRVDFTKEILSRKPEYAHKLNSQGQSPLHLASGAGHVEVVKLLVEKEEDAGACFICDKRGMTPLHVAARKGRLEVLKELVLAEPAAAWVLTEQGEPILHLCARNGQFEALKMLIDLIPDDDFLNMKDDEDNSILHLLASEIQTEVLFGLEYAHAVQSIKEKLVVESSMFGSSKYPVLHYADVMCSIMNPSNYDKALKGELESSNGYTSNGNLLKCVNNNNILSPDNCRQNTLTITSSNLGGLTWSLPQEHNITDCHMLK